MSFFFAVFLSKNHKKSRNLKNRILVWRLPVGLGPILRCYICIMTNDFDTNIFFLKFAKFGELSTNRVFHENQQKRHFRITRQMVLDQNLANAQKRDSWITHQKMRISKKKNYGSKSFVVRYMWQPGIGYKSSGNLQTRFHFFFLDLKNDKKWSKKKDTLCHFRCFFFATFTETRLEKIKIRQICQQNQREPQNWTTVNPRNQYGMVLMAHTKVPNFLFAGFFFWRLGPL